MIIIKNNAETEMMTIINEDGQEIFYGNHWDFHNDPNFIKTFLEDLGLDVELEEEKEIGEDFSSYDENDDY